MILEGTYTAVVDRIEAGDDGQLAVLVVEINDESTEEVIVPVAELPDGGRSPDTVLEVTIEPQLTSARIKADETEDRAESVQARFDRLSQRPSDGDDDVPKS